MKHVITLQGCDDSIRIPIDLTPQEMTVIERLVAHIDQTRLYGCQPYIIIDGEDT